MFSNLKRKWKFSSIRFYILNTVWNYNFWIRCTKEYTELKYYHFESLRESPKTIIKKRFVGYRYKGILYIDNPGFPIKDKEVWSCWKKKNLF